MEILNEKSKKDSSKEFEKLLTKDLSNRKFVEGDVISGTITKIDNKYCFVDVGAKSEGIIPIDEFKLTKEIDKIKIGSKIEVLLEKLESYSGELVVSREKARKVHAWKKMEKAYENKEEVEGQILSKCKGGFVVSVDSCLCFLPSSQVDLKPLKNIDHLMKTPQVFECVKLDKKRGNIVLSRRSILEKKRNITKDELLEKIKEGDIVNCVVKNLTDWGCFVDINGIDALCHITDISYSRVNKPSDLINLGQTLKVKIIKIDPETKKVSVSVKDLHEDPYIKAEKEYKVGSIYPATISKVTEYGAFATLGDGLEGLIHSSEISWTKKNVSPRKILSNSQKINVVFLEIDKDKRRISLSYKQTLPNPWKEFAEKNKVGDVVNCVVKNITDYALFLTVDNSIIDGMVHYRDLGYSENEEDLKKYKKNEKVKAKILEINIENEKLRLSIKSLQKDPFDFFDNKKVKDIITVKVKEVQDNGIKVKIPETELDFIIKKNQIATNKEDARPSRFAKGDSLDVMIIELSKEKRKVSLSIKSLEEEQKKEVLKKYGSVDSGKSLPFADLFRRVKKKKEDKSEKE